MLLSEAKEQILSLGFEDTSVLEDTNYQKVFRDGINKALTFINVEFPLIGEYTHSLDGTGVDLDEIDFADFSDFDVLLNATIKEEVGGRYQIRPFADFELVQDTKVFVSQTNNGEITFYYRQRPTFITTSTTDGTTLTIHYKAEQLLPLLACYYIWNDDDPEKASKWRNEYEDMKSIILRTTQRPIPLTFTGGF